MTTALKLIVVGCLIYVGVLLYDIDDAFSLELAGYRITMPVIGAIVSALLLILLIYIVIRIVLFIFSSPQRLRTRMQASRAKTGRKALEDGLIAVRLGNAEDAFSMAKKANKALGRDNPLVLLLEADSARLSNDSTRIAVSQKRLLSNETSRMLALKNATMQAIEGHDATQARTNASSAIANQPKRSSNNRWANEVLFQLALSEKDWTSALDQLEKLSAKNKKSREVARTKAVLLSAKARDDASIDLTTAFRSAIEAMKQDRTLLYARIISAKLAQRMGKKRQAIAIIKETWGFQPHSDLAKVFMTFFDGASPRKKKGAVENLCSKNNGSPDSAMLRAQVALENDDVETAYNALRYYSDDPSQTICLELARVSLLLKREDSREESRRWLAKALEARRDKAWVDGERIYSDWQPVTANGELGVIDWRDPPATGRNNDVMRALTHELTSPLEAIESSRHSDNEVSESSSASMQGTTSMKGKASVIDITEEQDGDNNSDEPHIDVTDVDATVAKTIQPATTAATPTTTQQ